MEHSKRNSISMRTHKLLSIFNIALKINYYKNPLKCVLLPACGFVAQSVVTHN